MSSSSRSGSRTCRADRALAKICKAELLTGDEEFKALANEIKIRWLK